MTVRDFIYIRNDKFSDIIINYFQFVKNQSNSYYIALNHLFTPDGEKKHMIMGIKYDLIKIDAIVKC